MGINKNQLVSICIPTYNGEQFIAEALDSAINQTYANLEIVVSDDASKDETLAIVDSYIDKTLIPINIYKHKSNGIGANWNHCIQKANGVYIKFLFQDDILLPDCIEQMVNVLENEPNIPIVASKRSFIVENSFINDSSSNWIETYSDLQKKLKLNYKNGICYLDMSLFRHPEFFKSPLNKIGEPSVVMFRKEIVRDIGYFREDLKQVLDYEYFYRVLKTKKIALVDDILVCFRLHDKQATVVNKNDDVFEKDIEVFHSIIYKKHLKYLDSYHKKVFLRKYNPFVKCFYKFIDTIRKL